MEKLKFSIVVCAYGNHRQFSNFLWTAYCQDFENYEIVVVDNATPGHGIFNACKKYLSKVRYFAILPEEKKCKNITQGINLAVKNAIGEYIIIIADSNVLLSFNLLKEISKLINDNVVILSSGMNDIKISPMGSIESEKLKDSADNMAKINQELLVKMGWPCDPIDLDLLKVPHRFPPPHKGYDCYIVALSKKNFTGYNEKDTEWGQYHEKFVTDLASKLKPVKLKNVRIVHQYHRCFMRESA